MLGKLFQRVSEAPTNPHAAPVTREFDVAELYRGPVQVDNGQAAEALPLDEKLWQAYFWIVNHAVISPFYDVEYHEGPPQNFVFGDAKGSVTLPSGQSYCSFVLLPLLTFAVRAKCLLVGGPGRGKTSSATLMGVLAGYPIRDVRRAIQKGQPQMTIADLIGSPLPADMVTAKSLDQIGIGWRKWLSMRVKIIDEYNRIPTRTQSALLTLMAENYLADLQIVDDARRTWVARWLEIHGLPSIPTGSYYVKSFTLATDVPASIQPLTRDGLVRLCFKPPQIEG